MVPAHEATSDDTTTVVGARRAAARSDAGPAYQARREEIVAAAGALFLERGYRSTSFHDIGSAVGLDRASLYYYFAGKLDLFLAATGDAVVRNTDEIERAAESDATFEDKIRAIVRVLTYSYLETDYPFMFIMKQETMDGLASGKSRQWQRSFHQQADRYQAALERVFAEGVASGAVAPGLPARVLTKALDGMIDGTHRWYRPDGAFSPAEIADIFADLFLRGVLRRDDAPLDH